MVKNRCSVLTISEKNAIIVQLEERMNGMEYDSYYERYLYAEEADVTERALTWDVAVGLQAVDGLQVSGYLRNIAEKHIQGQIGIQEVQASIEQYYAEHKAGSDSSENEADKVAANITEILNEPAFLFTPGGFVAIHRKLFHNVFKFAGKIRDYNISKKEWVLDGDSVSYGYASELRAALDYDIDQEKQFSYIGLSNDQMIGRISRFISGLWQIHPFPEGNTRTTAVFCIKYLRYQGFTVDNRMFAHHAKYFRDALVRANYTNRAKGVKADYSFLYKFFRNLLLGEKHTLKSRFTHILATPAEPAESPPVEEHKARIQDERTPVTVDPYVGELLKAIGGAQMNVREMMESLGLKGRDNFLKKYLNPALAAGCMRMLYPDNPRHPRQKYQLTARGSLAWQDLHR